jgi:hypothetical protein
MRRFRRVGILTHRYVNQRRHVLNTQVHLIALQVLRLLLASQEARVEVTFGCTVLRRGSATPGNCIVHSVVRSIPGPHAALQVSHITGPGVWSCEAYYPCQTV